MPAFDIDIHNVTNAEFMEFVDAGGYGAREFWSAENWEWLQQEGLAQTLDRGDRHSGHPSQGMARDVRGDSTPAGLACVRQPGRGERVRALEESASADGGGIPPRTWYTLGCGACVPLGGAPPRVRPGARQRRFTSWDPVPVGSYPAGASAWGVHDLVGNGWEWTSTIFGRSRALADGLVPGIPADFFDGQHFVMKGDPRRPPARSFAAASATGSDRIIRTFVRDVQNGGNRYR